MKVVFINLKYKLMFEIGIKLIHTKAGSGYIRYDHKVYSYNIVLKEAEADLI